MRGIIQEQCGTVYQTRHVHLTIVGDAVIILGTRVIRQRDAQHGGNGDGYRIAVAGGVIGIIGYGQGEDQGPGASRRGEGGSGAGSILRPTLFIDKL